MHSKSYPLITWLFWPGRIFHSWVPPDYNNQKDHFKQTVTTEHHTDNRLKCIPRLFVKNTYLLVLELQPEGQTSGLPHIYRLQKCSTECRWRDTIFVLSLGLITTHWCLPERSLYTCLKLQFWQLLPRRHL